MSGTIVYHVSPLRELQLEVLDFIEPIKARYDFKTPSLSSLLSTFASDAYMYLSQFLAAVLL